MKSPEQVRPKCAGQRFLVHIAEVGVEGAACPGLCGGATRLSGIRSVVPRPVPVLLVLNLRHFGQGRGGKNGLHCEDVSWTSQGPSDCIRSAELPYVASCRGKGGWECLLSGQNVDFVILREGKNGYFCLPRRLMYKNRIYRTGKRGGDSPYGWYSAFPPSLKERGSARRVLPRSAPPNPLELSRARLSSPILVR